MTQPDYPIKIRSLRETDRGLVIQTWLRHARQGFRWMPRKAYDRLMERAIKKMLISVPVWVVCLESNEDAIIGWTCGDPTRALVHFVFVKDDFRRQGIARRMLAEIQAESDHKLSATTWTPAGEILCDHCVFMNGYRPNLFSWRNK